MTLRTSRTCSSLDTADAAYDHPIPACAAAARPGGPRTPAEVQRALDAVSLALAQRRLPGTSSRCERAVTLPSSQPTAEVLPPAETSCRNVFVAGVLVGALLARVLVSTDAARSRPTVRV